MRTSDSATPTAELLDLTTDALAVYRITRIITRDEIAAPLREKVFSTFGPPEESKISYLVTCPHCVGVYVGAATQVARMIAPTAWRHLSRALATAAINTLINEREADGF